MKLPKIYTRFEDFAIIISFIHDKNICFASNNLNLKDVVFFAIGWLFFKLSTLRLEGCVIDRYGIT